MDQAIKPLGGHEVLLVLLQLAAILTIARLGSEFVRRLGLPTVIGELAAGILLGPTVLGHFFPQVFLRLFPPVSEQYHLLEIVSWLGMVLLLLLTGLETDVRLLRNLGRTALAASIFGMVVPFGFGLALGIYMPENYVANPDHRMVFALFLATAMSISAMPVIAKILIDLDLTRRNIGVVILSAGVVDDTSGWILLSLIAGAATTGNANFRGLAISVGGTALFLVFAALILYPILRVAFRVASDRFLSKGTDLVLLLVVTLLCAAATDAIGVHAVFGAFVAGCVVRQVPRLQQEMLHKLEAVTFAILAPVFFGLVGLKVDLWKLESGTMLLYVLGVATAGKLIGCTAGSLLGGLRFWESFSIAVAMNARGAMELVVATIGLSLGILNQPMYSIVVMVAVITSFMAPVLLRLTMRMVRMTEEEAERIAADEAKGLFDPTKLRILVPTAGGPNALVAAQIALRVAHRSSQPLTIMYVERATGLLDRLLHLFKKPNQEGRDLERQLVTIRSHASNEGAKPPEIRKVTSRNVVEPIAEEAAKGYDIVMVGASETRAIVRGEKLEQIVSGAPCHVAIVKSRRTPRRGDPERYDGTAPPDAMDPTLPAVSRPNDTARLGQPPFLRILVPVDGTIFSRFALEFALRYSEGVGERSEVIMAVTLGPSNTEPTRPPLEAAGPGSARANSLMMMADKLTQQTSLEKLSPVFKATKAKTRVLFLKPSPGTADQMPLLNELRSGRYDLVVISAENRAIHYRLFFGYENERLVEESPVPVVLVVPKVKTA